MNYKKISLKQNVEIIPLSKSLLNPNIDPKVALENLVLEVQAQIRKDKELQGISFLDMVPQELRDHVEHIATTAYTKRGITDMPLNEFIELIAENWLIKRTVFIRIAKEFGFKHAQRIDRNADLAALVLTSSASFVVISKPEESGERSVLYMRIKEREAHKIPEFQKAALKHSIVLGNRVRAGELNSSPALDILVDRDADLGKLRRTSELVNFSFASVDRYTVIFGFGNVNGNDKVN